MDPIDPSKLIRWGRGEARSPDGKIYGNAVDNDWYCERTYMQKFGHLFTSRIEFKRKLEGDKVMLDGFMKHRNDFIDSGRGTGKCRFPRSSAGSGNPVKVSRKTTAKTELKAPNDKFYTEKHYKETFGWPIQKANGHRRVKFGPHKGIAVPGDQVMDQPWEIINTYGKGLEMEDGGAEVVTDGEDEDGPGGETKFEELVDQHLEQYSEMVKGKTHGEMMAMVQADGAAELSTPAKATRYSSKLLSEWCASSASDTFWNADAATAQFRSLNRYIGILKNEIDTAEFENAESATTDQLSMSRLQIIEASMKIFSKKRSPALLQEFKPFDAFVQRFAERAKGGAPRDPEKCSSDFFENYRLGLELEYSFGACPISIQRVSSMVLARADVDEMRAKILEGMVAALVRPGFQTASVAKRIADQCEAFLESAPEVLRPEISAVVCIARATPGQELEQVMSEMNAAATDARALQQAFGRHKHPHGQAILDQAAAELKEWKNSAEKWGDIKVEWERLATVVNGGRSEAIGADSVKDGIVKINSWAESVTDSTWSVMGAAAGDDRWVAQTAFLKHTDFVIAETSLLLNTWAKATLSRTETSGLKGSLVKAACRPELMGSASAKLKELAEIQLNYNLIDRRSVGEGPDSLARIAERRSALLLLSRWFGSSDLLAKVGASSADLQECDAKKFIELDTLDASADPALVAIRANADIAACLEKVRPDARRKVMAQSARPLAALDEGHGAICKMIHVIAKVERLELSGEIAGEFEKVTADVASVAAAYDDAAFAELDSQMVRCAAGPERSRAQLKQLLGQWAMKLASLIDVSRRKEVVRANGMKDFASAFEGAFVRATALRTFLNANRNKMASDFEVVCVGLPTEEGVSVVDALELYGSDVLEKARSVAEAEAMDVVRGVSKLHPDKDVLLSPAVLRSADLKASIATNPHHGEIAPAVMAALAARDALAKLPTKIIQAQSERELNSRVNVAKVAIGLEYCLRVLSEVAALETQEKKAARVAAALERMSKKGVKVPTYMKSHLDALACEGGASDAVLAPQHQGQSRPRLQRAARELRAREELPYQRRLFVLECGRFSWYDPSQDPSSNCCKGSLDFVFNPSVVEEDPGAPDSFSIRPVNGLWVVGGFTGAHSGRVLEFRCCDPNLPRARWLEALKAHAEFGLRSHEAMLPLAEALGRHGPLRSPLLGEATEPSALAAPTVTVTQAVPTVTVTQAAGLPEERAAAAAPPAAAGEEAEPEAAPAGLAAEGAKPEAAAAAGAAAGAEPEDMPVVSAQS
ncbi:unnamed protein product [Prorocentrum cordatum]|uniref:Uncharacterized protein n=1 Tax=Prorocentrum cordatum TaxID=2364126 RepID=A0ABN9U852_9DINO|nr:unnamed protein product [Polarella glacialis]